MKNIAIVGAGVGGLATALRLAHRGCRVTVFEKNNYIGGRNRTLQVGRCRFDSGPTLLMMLDPFRKLFADVGEDFDAALQPTLCDPSYRVFWRDGSSIDATTDVERMQARLMALVGEEDARAYPGFLGRIKRLYEEAIPNFVRTNFSTLADVAHPQQLSRVVRHRMLGNLAREVSRSFQDERTRMLFSFQSMYLGLSPFQAPFVYSTLAYMEYGEGIFYPKGGLGRITDQIAELARERGASIRLESPIESVKGSAVTLSDGTREDFDAVVVNADLPYTQEKLEGQPKKSYRNSCSAHLLYLEYQGELPKLAHHNVFFGSDYEGNFEDLFGDLRFPVDPAFYVCASCKSDASAAPTGVTNLFVLIPVPNLSYGATHDEVRATEDIVFDRLTETVGFEARRVGEIERRGPAEWESELNLHEGAAFGISADLFQSAFMRPRNKSKQAGVYYVGASTVPGNGLPMVLISAELVESRLEKDGVI